MAFIKYLVDIDLDKNQLTQAALQNLATAPGSPVTGQIYWDTVLDTARVWNGSVWIDLGSDGVTNLGYTPSATDGTVTSDTGTDATIPAGSGTDASLMLPGDKTKLDGVEAGADVTDAANVDAAGAVMESDISATPSGRIIDDDTMGTASQTTLATSASIKAYVDSIVAGGMIYKGGYNASTNTPDLDSTPIATAIGDTYTITAAGTFFTEDVQVGDLIVARVANATALSDWTIVNKNIPDIVPASETEEGLIELATQAEADAGSDSVRAITPATLAGVLGVTGSLTSTLKYTSLIGDGSLTTIVVTHNIGKEHVQSQIFDAATGDLVICEVENTSINTTTFKFNTAPALNSLRVVIIG